MISIIVPVYNRIGTLDICIQSILCQTYKDFELILVDDGSDDGSEIVCNNYLSIDHRVRVAHKKNEGVSAARNAGLDMANGKYIGWVDSDDYIMPDMFETLIRLIEHYDADISECGFIKIADNSKITGKFGMGIETGEGNFLIEKYLSDDIFYGLWSKLFRKEIFSSFRFPKLIIQEDKLFSLYLCIQNYRYVRTSEAKYYYIENGTGITQSEISKRKARDYIYLLENKLAIVHTCIADESLQKRVLEHTKISGVFWYLGLALSEDSTIRRIYSRLYLKKLDIKINACLRSKKIPLRNKISFLLCRIHLNRLALYLKVKRS